jgi:predicted XRE-type DNA-binding protein
MIKMANYTVSSGNIFKDLEFPNPDEELAKVKLASKINRLIANKGMTQKQAAKFLGLSRNKMTSLRNGRLGNFSLDMLFSLLGKLDYHVEIRVRQNSESATSETISVAQI